MVTLAERPDIDDVDALVRENEGWTAVAPLEVAEREGWHHAAAWAWLTLDVYSALDAVGLTAAFAEALAVEGVPCNTIAGFHHDHILVPADAADRAIAAIEALRHSADDGI